MDNLLADRKARPMIVVMENGSSPNPFPPQRRRKAAGRAHAVMTSARSRTWWSAT